MIGAAYVLTVYADSDGEIAQDRMAALLADAKQLGNDVAPLELAPQSEDGRWGLMIRIEDEITD